MCGVDCKGKDVKDIEYDGSSFAVDFKGNDITVPDPEGSDLLYAVLSLDRLNAFREKFPAYRDADPFRIVSRE